MQLVDSRLILGDGQGRGQLRAGCTPPGEGLRASWKRSFVSMSGLVSAPWDPSPLLFLQEYHFRRLILRRHARISFQGSYFCTACKSINTSGLSSSPSFSAIQGKSRSSGCERLVDATVRICSLAGSPTADLGPGGMTCVRPRSLRCPRRLSFRQAQAKNRMREPTHPTKMLLACSVHLEQSNIYFTATVNKTRACRIESLGEIPRSPPIKRDFLCARATTALRNASPGIRRGAARRPTSSQTEYGEDRRTRAPGWLNRACSSQIRIHRSSPWRDRCRGPRSSCG